MRSLLDRLLIWTERRLPENRQVWLSDLRAEAEYVPAGLARMRFQLSGLSAAIGHLLRFKFGPQKMGQLLLGIALIILCLGMLIFAQTIEDKNVQTAFYAVLTLYSLAGSLAVTDLDLMKRFTIICSLLLGVIWMILGLGTWPSLNASMEFLRAFTLEAAFVMATLFIVASYLGWIETAGHA